MEACLRAEESDDVLGRKASFVPHTAVGAGEVREGNSGLEIGGKRVWVAEVLCRQCFHGGNRSLQRPWVGSLRDDAAGLIW